MGGLYYFFEYLPIDDSNSNKKISFDQISDTRMEKVVYDYETIPNIRFVDIPLSDDQIRKIVEWINSVPDSDVMKWSHVPSSISAGIVFRLKFNREIRIQYDLKNVYITRTDSWRKQTKYTIRQDDLKRFFDEQ